MRREPKLARKLRMLSFKIGQNHFRASPCLVASRDVITLIMYVKKKLSEFSCSLTFPKVKPLINVQWVPFTRVRTNLCTDKNLHGYTLSLHGTGGTRRIFEQLSVQVWDQKKAGQLFDRHGSIYARTRVNTRSVQRFA